MGFNYDSTLKTASRLLTRFGGKFTYTSRVTGTYDPATRTQSGTDTVVAVKGVFVGPGQTSIDGTVIQIGQGRFVLDAKGITITPRQGDILRAEGIDYFVNNVRIVNPSGKKVVLYILELNAGSK